MYETLTTELSGSIYIITINRPEKLNALNKTVIREIGEAVDEVYKNPLIRAAIITGAGNKAFAAGADISGFGGLSRDEGKALAQQGMDVFFKIENATKPIVAAVNGFALGGGCELGHGLSFQDMQRNGKIRTTRNQSRTDSRIWGNPAVNPVHWKGSGHGSHADREYDQRASGTAIRTGKSCNGPGRTDR